MVTRKSGLVLIAAALAPTISLAGSPSFDACVNAFAKSMAPDGAPTPAYKVIYHEDRATGSISEYYPARFTYDLEARSVKAGVIARARCRSDGRGTVVALSPLPLPKDGEESPAVESLD